MFMLVMHTSAVEVSKIMSEVKLSAGRRPVGNTEAGLSKGHRQVS